MLWTLAQHTHPPIPVLPAGIGFSSAPRLPWVSRDDPPGVEFLDNRPRKGQTLFSDRKFTKTADGTTGYWSRQCEFNSLSSAEVGWAREGVSVFFFLPRQLFKERTRQEVKPRQSSLSSPLGSSAGPITRIFMGGWNSATHPKTTSDSSRSFHNVE